MSEMLKLPSSGSARRILIVGYAITAPMFFSSVVWSAVVGAPSSGLGFGILFSSVLMLALASIVTSGILYKEITSIRSAEIPWTPSLSLYLGTPVGGGLMTYLIATYHFGSINPTGDAVYGYAAFLWGTTAIYVYQRHRSLSD